MDLLQSVKEHLWTEIRKLVYDYEATGKDISFNYNTLTHKYMITITTGKLNDLLRFQFSSSGSQTTSDAHFSLPKIELPKFTRELPKFTELQGFISLFDRMSHKNGKK